MATRSLRQRHAEGPQLVELLYQLQVKLVLVGRLVLHARQKDAELCLDVFESHMRSLAYWGLRVALTLYGHWFTDYSTGKSK